MLRRASATALRIRLVAAFKLAARPCAASATRSSDRTSSLNSPSVSRAAPAPPDPPAPGRRPSCAPWPTSFAMSSKRKSRRCSALAISGRTSSILADDAVDALLRLHPVQDIGHPQLRVAGEPLPSIVSSASCMLLSSRRSAGAVTGLSAAIRRIRSLRRSSGRCTEDLGRALRTQLRKDQRRRSADARSTGTRPATASCDLRGALPDAVVVTVF